MTAPFLRWVMRALSKLRPSPMLYRCGWTLTELFVIVGIVVVLLALLAPAVVFVREAADKASCAGNLRQIGLGIHNYQSEQGLLPTGCSYENGRAAQPHMSWHARLLPFLERNDLWARTLSAYENEKLFLRNPPHVGLDTVVATYICPSDGRLSRAGGAGLMPVAYTSYLGVEGLDQAHRNGVLFLDSRLRIGDVRDGLSNTVFVGERPPSADGVLGWWYAGWGFDKDGSGDSVLGVRAINAGSVWAKGCPIGSYSFAPPRHDPCNSFHFWSIHPSGAHFLFGDGSVRFLRYSIGDALLLLATRSGGEAVTLPD